MAPYLRTVTSFADVPVTDAGIDTPAFLNAAQGVLGLFDLLGSSAFSVVQSDIKGNIAKVNARYQAAPTLSTTLQQLVKNETAEKKHTATQGLLWLLRGLSFTSTALQHAQTHRTDELSVAFQKSYDQTLRQYHNFVVRGVFSVALKACPYRADFFAKLSADPAGGPAASPAELDAALDGWLGALARDVRTMEDFYAKGGYGKGL
ncbi:glycolipid transfer protein [Vararia minispora EC-137]|uniref:Glycolipid transfer protein n=1 Tax=Vararia minispora EC-137 TaxID=1314806 RepID=A0ACB8QE90_9AGAM|nr:glycolipid transfer protein [Vararia minispora EC-137]